MKLFGKKTNAVFDFWSLGHVALYFGVTRLFLINLPIERAILALVILGYTWELVERMLENSNSRFIRNLFPEKECWQNRYIGDILADIIGFGLAYGLY